MTVPRVRLAGWRFGHEARERIFVLRIDKVRCTDYHAALSTRWTKSGGGSPGRPTRHAARPRDPTVARTEYPSKATHQQTRALNPGLVLRTLYDLGPISRADIARLTGLTRTSVGELVGDLERDGLAREVGRGPSTGGKQPTLVQLVDDARTVIGLDLGERRFTAALADLRGNLSARRHRDLGRRRADGEAAVAARPRPHRRHPRRGDQPDPRHRRRHPGHRRRRRHDPLGGQPRLAGPAARPRSSRERHGLPTFVANDSRAAAFASTCSAATTARRTSSSISVGRGIGAGLILRGEPFGGDGDGAGEIGHVVVEPDGAACRCGRFGCLETVASSRPSSRPPGRPALDRASRPRPTPAATSRALTAVAPGRPGRRGRPWPR